MQINWKNELNRKGRRVVLSNQPVAMHCHHYNINLQKTLEDTLGEEGVRLLYQAAEEASFDGFQTLFSQHKKLKTTESKLEFAADIYQNCGLGIIRFQETDSRGGQIISPAGHHVTGWLAKHGMRKTPGCHFSRGWIAGVLEVIHEHPPGYYSVKELACKMMRNETCVFQVTEKLKRKRKLKT